MDMVNKGDDPKVCCSSVENHSEASSLHSVMTVAGRGTDNIASRGWEEGSVESDGLVDGHS